MCKKFLIYGGALSILIFALAGTSAVARLQHGVAWVRSQMEENVPVEMELDRARALIEQADEQILKQKEVLARKQVSARRLESAINGDEETYARGLERLQYYHGKLQTSQVSYRIGRREVSRVILEAKAGRLLGELKGQEKMIMAKKDQLVALAKAAEYAETTLENFISEQSRLKTLAIALETKLRQTEAMQAATSDDNVDKTDLSQAKSILEKCGERLDVMQQMMENESSFSLHESLDIDLELEESDLDTQISDFLGRDCKVESKERELEALPAGY